MSINSTVSQQANISYQIRVQTRISRLRFDKRDLKKALRQGGGVVRSEARRLISRRAVSLPGQFPGYQSGAMSRSIKIKMGSGGGYAKVMPFKTPEMGKDFYPAYLIYGSNKNNLKPRKDFILAALEKKRAEIKRMIIRSVINAVRAQ
jgi:hypothetical protein